MSKLKYLFNALRHPVKALRSSKAVSSITKSPAFTDTVKKLYNDPNTRSVSFDDLESGAWKNASNTATKALTNYGDDVVRAVDNVDDFVPTATLPDLDSQAALKARLLDKRLPYDHYEHISPPASTTPEIGDFIQGYSDDVNWGRFPRSTETLGNVATDLFDNNGVIPIGDDNMLLHKPIDTSQLVVDNLRPRGQFTKQFTLRPHKNTALGRWYDKIMQEDAMVRESFLYNDPTSPLFDLDDYYRGISFDDDTLPF